MQHLALLLDLAFKQSVNYYSVTDEWATIQAQPYSWTLRRL
jgi:hypothetical protein